MAALGHGKCSQHSSEEGMFSLFLARITRLQGHLVPSRFATQARGGEAVAPGQGRGSPSRLRGRVSDKNSSLELICGPRRHSQTQQQRLWGWGGGRLMKGCLLPGRMEREEPCPDYRAHLCPPGWCSLGTCRVWVTFSLLMCRSKQLARSSKMLAIATRWELSRQPLLDHSYVSIFSKFSAMSMHHFSV